MIDKTGCVGNTIITSSGNYFDLGCPRAEDVNLLDIAWSLAKECRYTGQIGHNERHYSVAEHSVRCMLYALRELKVQDGQALRSVFFHDASEAFTGDVNRPLKNLLRSHTDAFEVVERGIDAAIAERFDCDFVGHHDLIKKTDYFMMFTEKRFFFNRPNEGMWTNEFSFVPVSGYDPDCWSVKDAANEFLEEARWVLSL